MGCGGEIIAATMQPVAAAERVEVPQRFERLAGQLRDVEGEPRQGADGIVDHPRQRLDAAGEDQAGGSFSGAGLGFDSGVARAAQGLGSKMSTPTRGALRKAAGTA
jgi:hypothetical protein